MATKKKSHGVSKPVTAVTDEQEVRRKTLISASRGADELEALHQQFVESEQRMIATCEAQINAWTKMRGRVVAIRSL